MIKRRESAVLGPESDRLRPGRPMFENGHLLARITTLAAFAHFRHFCPFRATRSNPLFYHFQTLLLESGLLALCPSQNIQLRLGGL